MFGGGLTVGAVMEDDATLCVPVVLVVGVDEVAKAWDMGW